MYRYDALSRWKSQQKRFESMSVACPSCKTVNPLIPVQVDGLVLDAEHSSESRFLYMIGKYPAFIPEGYPYPGYMLLSCLSCSNYMLAEVPLSGGPTVKWPLADTSVSEDIPEPVHSAVADAKLAHSAGSKTGAIMSARTAVERIQRHEDAGSLSELWEQKKLPPSLFDTANEPRLWGHVIAHDDFNPEAVTLSQVADLLDFLDTLLHLVYVIPADLERAKQTRKNIE